MGYAHVHRNISKPRRLETFSKNVFIGLNIIFVVFGFILFVYGCGGTHRNRDSYTFLTENGGDIFQFTSNILIVIGVILAFVGLWGLCGLTSYFIAYLYIFLLILMAFMDITLGVYSSSIEQNAKINVEHNLIRSLKQLKDSQRSTDPTVVTIREGWNSLQAELKCCGIYEYSDWYLPTYDPNPSSSGNGSHYGINSEDLMRIPHSCFKNGDDGMADSDFTNPVDPEVILENVHDNGCLEKTVVDLDIDRMQRVGILLAVSKILAVICAVVVTCYMRDDKEAMYV